MIIVFPMICSNSVDYSAIPGVAKSMERYILIHKLDDVLRQTKKQFKNVRGRLQLKEDSDDYVLSEEFHDLVNLCEAKEISGIVSKDIKDEIERLEKERENLKDEKRKFEIDKKIEQLKQKKNELESKQKDIKDASTKVSMQVDSLSLEPTYMQVDRFIEGNKLTDLIGIKVVPFIVQSDEKLVNLLMYDKQLKRIDSLIVSMGRKIKKKIYNFYKSALSKLPVVGSVLSKRKTISGDPKSDVILAKTDFRENVFVCVNRLDFEDDFFQSTSDINKLFKLGWGAVISLDDSKKTAYFCVHEFKGMCFPVQYSFLYSTLGKDHGKVYEDLSDVRKAAGGIFRKKLPRGKVFENEIKSKYIKETELLAFSNMEKFILEQGSFEGKKETLGVVRKLSQYFKSVKSGDLNNIEATLNRLGKKKDINNVKKDLEKKIPSFKKGYDLGKRSFKKKIKFQKVSSDRVIEFFAVLCGIYALKDYVSGSMKSMENTKGFINKMSKSFDKSIKKVEDETKKNDDEPADHDYIIGLTCVATLSAMIIPITSYIVYLVTFKHNIVVNLFASAYNFIELILVGIVSILAGIWTFFTEVLVPLAEGTVAAAKFISELLGKLIELISKLNDFSSEHPWFFQAIMH